MSLGLFGGILAGKRFQKMLGNRQCPPVSALSRLFVARVVSTNKARPNSKLHNERLGYRYILCRMRVRCRRFLRLRRKARKEALDHICQHHW